MAEVRIIKKLTMRWSYQEIGTGCGHLFIIIRNIKVYLSFFKMFLKLISSILRMIYYSLNYNRTKKIYYHRFSGLINSIFGKSSWYRPKL